MIKEFKKGSKTKISKNFNSSEFDCKCKRAGCKTTYIDMELIDQLEELRAEIACPLTIVSGFRCVDHNKNVGGKKGSLHLVGKAADISSSELTHKELQFFCEDFDGLGKGLNLTHVDVRGYKARWRY